MQGTLALTVLKTLDVLGPQHGYGIARRIEQISGDLLAVNQGTLYPLLLKLEHEGSIASEWGASENNRRARFYRLTATGRKQLREETHDWEQTAAIIARFFNVKAEDIEVYVARGDETEIRAYAGQVESLTSASSAGIMCVCRSKRI